MNNPAERVGPEGFQSMFETENSSYMVRNSAMLRKVAEEMEMKWK